MAFRLRSQGAPFKQVGSSPALKHISPVKQIDAKMNTFDRSQNQGFSEYEDNQRQKQKNANVGDSLDLALTVAGMNPASGAFFDGVNFIQNSLQAAGNLAIGDKTEAKKDWSNARWAAAGFIPFGVGMTFSAAKLARITNKMKEAKTAYKAAKTAYTKTNSKANQLLFQEAMNNLNTITDIHSTWNAASKTTKVNPKVTNVVKTATEVGGDAAKTTGKVVDNVAGNTAPPGKFSKWWNSGSQVNTVTDPKFITDINPLGIVSTTNSATNGQKALKYALYLGGATGATYLLNMMRTSNADAIETDAVMKEFTDAQKDSAQNAYNIDPKNINSSYDSTGITVPINPDTGEPYGETKIDNDFD